MIRRILRWCRGYVRLEVRGAALERFINLCRVNGVEVWAVDRREIDEMTLCMSESDWAWIEPLCGRTLCAAELLGRHSMALRLRPVRARKSLLAAALICLGLCWLAGQFVWQVRVEGCDRISQREIYDQLRQLGLEPGKLLSTVDSGRIRSLLMTLREDLSYVTVNRRGTEVVVCITEKDPDRQAGEPEQPCSLYADKTGIIESLQVREGEVLVQKGDTVVAGDLLVEGRMVSTQGETRLVAADAEVLLRTWPTVEISMHPELYGLYETGQCITRRSLIIGRRRLTLPCIEKIGDACYYKTMEMTAVSPGEGYFFPVALVREVWHLCTAERLELSEKACGEVLHAACRAVLDAQCVENGVEETAFELTFTEEKITARLQAECLETTGTKIPITGEQ